MSELVGSVAGKFVRFAPEPENVVAVRVPVTVTPVFNVVNLVLLSYISCTASFSATKKFPAIEVFLLMPT